MIFSFTENKEELCVEGNSEGHCTGRETNIERSHVQHKGSSQCIDKMCVRVFTRVTNRRNYSEVHVRMVELLCCLRAQIERGRGVTMSIYTE